jgi:hypothetical protein
MAAGQAADDFKVEDGYTSLINGKDLTGWRYPGAKGETLDGKTETPDKRIQVVDGVIVVNEKDDKGKGGIKDLYTVKEYNGNFHLKLEFRAAPRADSGVYIRGPQLQVRDYPTVGPYKPKSFKNGDWNELDITVKNNVVTTTVNGKLLTEKDVLELTVKDGKTEAKLNGKPLTVTNFQVNTGAVALCKCNGEVIEEAFKAGVKGGIGLQAETGKFEFRRIRIKELP